LAQVFLKTAHFSRGIGELVTGREARLP